MKEQLYKFIRFQYNRFMRGDKTIEEANNAVDLCYGAVMYYTFACPDDFDEVDDFYDAYRKKFYESIEC